MTAIFPEFSDLGALLPQHQNKENSCVHACAWLCFVLTSSFFFFCCCCCFSRWPVIPAGAVVAAVVGLDNQGDSPYVVQSIQGAIGSVSSTHHRERERDKQANTDNHEHAKKQRNKETNINTNKQTNTLHLVLLLSDIGLASCSLLLSVLLLLSCDSVFKSNPLDFQSFQNVS